MFKIKQYKEIFQIYELLDKAVGSCVTVVPERGGIITGFSVQGIECLYLNRDTFANMGSPVSGGIPILFPIAGKLEGGQCSFNGKKYSMPQHGLARDHPWEVVATGTQDGASIKIRLKSNKNIIQHFPFFFELVFTYQLKENRLTIYQEYYNCSDIDMPVHIGFHPYFRITDNKTVKYEVDAAHYMDIFCPGIKSYRGSLDLNEENKTRILLDVQNCKVKFTDPEKQLQIKMEYSPEFKYLVFWSLADYPFVCIEPWTAKPNALNTGEDIIKIKPGKKHKSFISIEGCVANEIEVVAEKKRIDTCLSDRLEIAVRKNIFVFRDCDFFNMFIKNWVAY